MYKLGFYFMDLVLNQVSTQYLLTNTIVRSNFSPRHLDRKTPNFYLLFIRPAMYSTIALISRQLWHFCIAVHFTTRWQFSRIKIILLSKRKKKTCQNRKVAFSCKQSLSSKTLQLINYEVKFNKIRNNVDQQTCKKVLKLDVSSFKYFSTVLL